MRIIYLGMLLLSGCGVASAPPVKEPEDARRVADRALQRAEEAEGRLDELEARVDALENASR